MDSITLALSEPDRPVPGIDAALAAGLFVMHATPVQRWMLRLRGSIGNEGLVVIADDDWANPGDIESLTTSVSDKDREALQALRSTLQPVTNTGTAAADDPTIELERIDRLVADRDNLVGRIPALSAHGVPAVSVQEFNAAQDNLAAVVPRLLEVAVVAVGQHKRSLYVAYGMGSGDAHGRYYCAGACWVNIDRHTVYAVWPCKPYQEYTRILLGKQHNEATGTGLPDSGQADGAAGEPAGD